jgi:hypothetical protein
MVRYLSRFNNNTVKSLNSFCQDDPVNITNVVTIKNKSFITCLPGKSKRLKLSRYCLLGKLPGLVVNVKDSLSEPWSLDVSSIPGFA